MKWFLILLIIPGFLLPGCKNNPGEENSPDYAITVTYGENGTASADKQTAKKDEPVMLTANPKDSYKLEKWTVESGGVTIRDTEVNRATFTMPGGDVSIRASFSLIPPDDIFTAITDPVFKKYCERFDIGGDGILSPNEISAIRTINLASTGVASLDGIQYFTYLEYLDCGNNQLELLDVSNNTQLTRLYCSDNDLTSLDVSKNMLLTELNCRDNKLTSLDVRSNTQLTQLSCISNALTSLDVSNNMQLTQLSCSSNDLTSLDMSKNTLLTSLICYNNDLTSLNVSENPQLTVLQCYSNALTSLDVSKNTLLTNLYCNNNDLISLDVSNNTRLTTLVCNLNPLTEIIVWDDFDLENPTNSIEYISKDNGAQFVKK